MKKHRSEKMTGNCIDCGIDTLEIGEFYMLHDLVWLEANPERRGLLCVGCVEERLGRELIPDDFNHNLPINFASMQRQTCSERLWPKIFGEEPRRKVR